MSDQNINERMDELLEAHEEIEADTEQVDETMDRLEQIASEVEQNDIVVRATASRSDHAGQTRPQITLVYENDSDQATPDGVINWAHSNGLVLVSNVVDPNGHDVATVQAAEHSGLKLAETDELLYKLADLLQPYWDAGCTPAQAIDHLMCDGGPDSDPNSGPISQNKWYKRRGVSGNQVISGNVGSARDHLEHPGGSRR
jgi:hypothetical protein